MPYGYEGYYRVIGPPGTGKTTWCKRQLEAIVDKSKGFMVGGESPAIVCSLTRAAASEIAGRGLPIPPDATATLHAHGWRSQGSPPVAEGKLVEDWNSRCRWDHALTVRKKGGGTEDMTLGDAPSDKDGDKLLARVSELRGDMVPVEAWAPRLQDFHKAWTEFKDDTGSVDFTDMIEKADPTPPMGAGVIIVDEAQDMSALEFDLVHRWGKAAGAVILVGDPQQALYTWRGACPERLSGDAYPADHSKVLGRSYRVPAAVHKTAVAWVSQLSDYQAIDYRPTDADGRVMEIEERHDFISDAMIEEALASDGTTMLATSCNYMADRIAREFKSRGLPFANPWRVASGAWNPINATARRMVSFLAPPLEGRIWRSEELKHWIELLAAENLLRYGSKNSIKALLDDIPLEFDNYLDLFEPEALGELWGVCYGPLHPRVDEMLDWFDAHRLESKARSLVYPDKLLRTHGIDAVRQPPKLLVGTLHSFKGSEADRVYLFPDLSPRANEMWMGPPSRDRDGIIRAFYVGMTRAKKELFLCQPSDGRKAVTW